MGRKMFLVGWLQMDFLTENQGKTDKNICINFAAEMRVWHPLENIINP